MSLPSADPFRNGPGSPRDYSSQPFTSEYDKVDGFEPVPPLPLSTASGGRVPCCGSWSRRATVIVSVVVISVILAIGAGIGLGVGLNNKDGASQPPPPPPPPPEPTAPTPQLPPAFATLSPSATALLPSTTSSPSITLSPTQSDQAQANGDQLVGVVNQTIEMITSQLTAPPTPTR